MSYGGLTMQPIDSVLKVREAPVSRAKAEEEVGRPDPEKEKALGVLNGEEEEEKDEQKSD